MAEIYLPRGIAEISILNGRGIVLEEGKLYVIDINKMYEPEEAEGTNLNMWMQDFDPSGPKHMESGPYPFRDLYDQVKKEYIERAKAILASARSL